MPTQPTPSRPKEAKLFRNNRSQAVRIPVEFELQGDRVLIHREGGKLIIDPVTSIVVAAELRYGCAKKGSPKLLARVEGFLETIPVLPLEAACETAGEPGPLGQALTMLIKSL